MALPKRIPKEAKQESRWRSPPHRKFVAGFACCVCGSMKNTIAAHVRFGSHTGMGQKPDDWRTVPMCDGPGANTDGGVGCHQRQHNDGEATFWAAYRANTGQTVETLIEELIAASPKRFEIEQVRKERKEAA